MVSLERSKPGRAFAKGVKQVGGGQFRASITSNRQVHKLGPFQHHFEAQAAYNVLSVLLHGMYCRPDLNDYAQR